MDTQEDDLQAMSKQLAELQLDQPSLVIDLDVLDRNIKSFQSIASSEVGWRLVTKSLPSVGLLSYISQRLTLSGYMSFSPGMLACLLDDLPEGDHLLGKPFPVSACQRVLDMRANAAKRVIWLIDTEARLEEYAALARQREIQLRIALEVDVGLHRGGLGSEQLDGICSRIASEPALRLDGIMGYEAHLPKIPGPLRRSAERATDKALFKAAQAVQGGGAPIINSGGSTTFERYRGSGPVNDISIGSTLLQPSDFVSATTGNMRPAAFIASPILKVLPANPVPGLERLRFLRRSRQDLVIAGGNWMARPVHPSGFGYSSVFGRSSNQEIWTGPAQASVHPGQIALLHPSQSESVLAQFGSILAFRGGEIEATWASLHP